MDELNQEEYCIIIHNDNSIKIGKIHRDLSPPQLKRSSAGIHPDIYSVSEFSNLFQVLMGNNILHSTNNPNPKTLNSSFVEENHETISSLLPIVVDKSIGLDYSSLYPPPSSDEEDVKKIPERPKLSRTTTISIDLKKEKASNLEA